MAQNQNFYVNLKNMGKVNVLDSFNIPPFADIASLPTDIPEFNSNGDLTYQLAILENTGQQVFWKGGTIVEGAIKEVAGVGAWYFADKDQEVILNVDNPPVDTWAGDTQETGVAPTVTENTKLVTWTAPDGNVHLYQVERDVNGTVTGYTEITANKLATIEDNTLTSEADVLALSPLRNNTIYKNPDTNQIWRVDQYGNVTTLADGEYHVTLVTDVLSLTAFEEAEVNINDAEGGGVVLSRNPDILDGVDISTENEFDMIIVARDPLNNNQLSVDGWAIRQIDTERFGVTANIDVDVRLTAQFPAKREVVAAAPLNEFTFETGSTPTLAAFETLIGFSLVNGVINGDTITFDNTNYTISDNVFQGAKLISATLAIGVTYTSTSFESYVPIVGGTLI